MINTQIKDKLLILYILSSLSNPISKSCLEEFILSQKYLNYISLNETLSFLIDKKYIKKTSLGHKIEYSITKLGENTISMFIYHLSKDLKDDIQKYLKNNSYRIKNQTSIVSNFYKKNNNEYIFQGIIKENNSELFNICLNLPSLKEAKKASKNFEKNPSKIYSYIMNNLL